MMASRETEYQLGGTILGCQVSRGSGLGVTAYVALSSFANCIDNLWSPIPVELL